MNTIQSLNKDSSLLFKLPDDALKEIASYWSLKDILKTRHINTEPKSL